MSSADEVSFMNTFYGADLAACTAIDALAVIYRSEVILYHNCAGGAGLFAFAAGNTAVLTINTYLCALVVIVTGDRHASGVSDKMDYIVGTFFYAKTASDTFSRVYRSKSLVVDADCISRANLNAVAVAQAGEGAIVVTGVVQISGFAGFRTVIVVFSFLGQTEAVAGNVCNLLDNILCGSAHNFGNVRGGSVTAGDAEIGFVGFSLGESFSISITAGEAASAAVSTGKCVTDSKRLFVFLNFKISRGNREKQCAKHSCRKKNNNRN